jgi:hypothetical protein
MSENGLAVSPMTRAMRLNPYSYGLVMPVWIAPMAEGGGSDAPSFLSLALPLLAVAGLMFWFQRRLRVDQTKHQELGEQSRVRQREKTARSLDRILNARRPKDGDDQGSDRVP